ncbi:farnesol dehydrogenase-like [Photinus pyralis]|uniref:Dehydrogenase n=1 Tax=Photinus pyralis TaxID=7054 RepID=A0A1Y1L931_PHOPY|nr:farnesol dehydrogenase-like [Photinus pyralis]
MGILCAFESALRPEMDRWYGKVAVVTGASSGIGAAIAANLVNSGLKVVGMARRKGRLDEFQKNLEGKAGQFFPVEADVSKEGDIFRAFDWITQNVGVVHILVNCAGIIRPKGLIDGETSHWREIFDTNVLGLCVATREAIKIMRANEIDGHIVHINSVAGHYVPHLPDMNVYPASKFSVTALTETLRQELNAINNKIKVSSISPGLVKSELVSGVDVRYVEDDVLVLNPEDIADAVAYVISTPPHVQVHELTIRPISQTA